MDEEFLLSGPRPVPVSEVVSAAMGESILSHHPADFEAVYERIRNALGHVKRRR